MATQTQAYKSTPILTSAARTATGQSTAFDEGSLDTISVMVDVTAVSGTSPTMTVNVEWSWDNVSWFTADPVDAFTAITATGKKVKQFTIKGLYARLNYVIGGTTPSFTFSATAITGS
jgi:hypothetical protein